MVKRTYNAPRREEQARETRAAMIAAAHRLFVEQGYAATSIRQVAAEARVGEQTVYRVFGNKVTLLRDVILTAVSGTDEASAVADMEDLLARLRVGTPAERLRVIAAWSAAIYERGAADLEEVVFSAVAADPKVEELARFLREQRYRDVRALVEAVAVDTGPPPGVTLDDIADFIYAVWSSPVYVQLVRERGWTADKYVEWCVRMVERMFLDAPAP
jgi:AcrR family transcriptional regulator